MSDDIETGRGIVYPRELDHAGQLGMEGYARRFDEATWHFIGHLGMTPPFLRDEWRDVVVREQRVTFHGPVTPGTLLVVRTRLEEVQEKALRFTHRLLANPADGVLEARPVATMDVVVAHVDAIRRRSREWPSGVLVRGAQLMRAASAVA